MFILCLMFSGLILSVGRVSAWWTSKIVGVCNGWQRRRSRTAPVCFFHIPQADFHPLHSNLPFDIWSFITTIDIIPLAIKQISYLTMAFLPPSFAAAIFGMNVTALNPQGSVTLGQYFALVAPLTLLSVWFVIALEIDIKEVRVHRKSRGNRAGVVSDTKGQSKPSQYAVRKAIKRDDGDKCNDDEVGSDDERVEVRYGYKHQNRVASDEETETVWELDGWARLCWPFILISMALNKRRRRQKRKTKTKSAGSDTKTR